MKTTNIFSVLLVVFFFSTASGSKQAVPVLDADGEPLRTDVDYIVQQLNARAGVGPLAVGRGREICPEIVVQRAFGEEGTPVRFSNVDPNDNVVRLSSDVNIEFAIPRSKLCSNTFVWKLDDFDALTRGWWVTTGGVRGNPGPDTFTSWFKIERGFQFRAYKLRFCPSVCDSCSTFCSDIGLRGDFTTLQTRLALEASASPTYSEWIFVKANPTIKQVVS